MSAPSTARRVTTTDIARVVGVSRTTVGFVLNDTPGEKISDATRQKVLEAARRLGYRKNRAARTLASGQSRIVLLVLPDWPIESSLSAHLAEASQALDEAGFSLVTWTPHEHGHARPLWEVLQPDVVCGLVPFPVEQLEAIRRTGARVVVPEASTDHDGLGFAHGPALQLEHLAEQGHRRVVFAATADARLGDLAQDRYLVARRVGLQLGVDITRAVVAEEGGGPDVTAWRDAGVTAVAAYNDTIAARVVGAALRADLRVPEDLAVVGHDDAPIARLLVPALSSIRVDTSGLGRHLAGLALHALTEVPSSAPEPTAEVRLIRRETS